MTTVVVDGSEATVITVGDVGPPGQGSPGAAGGLGPPGFDGEDGADGLDGAPGQTGASGAPGFPGPPGFDGEDGADGQQGPSGLTGAIGATGQTGPQGEIGANGPTGPAGLMGARGLDGDNGDDGMMGAPGVQGAAGPSLTAGGRLTLTTALPVTVADVTAAATVYYTPYINDLVPIYNVGGWKSHTFTELSLPLDSTGDRLHAAGTNYDLFVFNDAGTLRLGTGVAWTSATARGTGAGTTEIARVNGLWTNAVTLSIKYGTADAAKVDVAANLAIYVGTMRASANGQCEDSLAKRFLWNTYNRVQRAMRRNETTDSWTYSTAAWRQMNNSVENQLAMVRGLDEDSVKAITTAYGGTSSAVVVNFFNGIGLDVVNAFSGRPGNMVINDNFSGLTVFQASYFGTPGLGYHFLAALEQGGGTASTETFYGDAGVPLNFQLGIHGEVRA